MFCSWTGAVYLTNEINVFHCNCYPNFVVASSKKIICETLTTNVVTDIEGLQKLCHFLVINVCETGLLGLFHLTEKPRISLHTSIQLSLSCFFFIFGK